MSGKQYVDEVTGIIVEKDDDLVIIQLDEFQANRLRCLARDHGYESQAMRGLSRVLFTLLSEEN